MWSLSNLRLSRMVRRDAVADQGSASLWLLALGLVIVAAGAAGAAVASAHLARHQARVAADLGSLAGAARVLDGPDATYMEEGR